MRDSFAIVHNGPVFLEIVAAALRDAGHDVVAFGDSVTALDEINAVGHFEVLVTRVSFPEGKPNGGFGAADQITSSQGDYRGSGGVATTHIEGIGELIPHPVNMLKLVETVTHAAEEGPRSSI